MHRQKVRRSSGKTTEGPIKEAAKPKGPLVIAVSINKQKVKIYDTNGLFAEAPVSTGMQGHPTPMGVFSVIQKDRYHHSNIYSGAPMPYMQRITWSGVAMHAGVLPGYPASHGCIRMPMDFAVKMWSWTKMGARVIVAPGELSPVEFSHPLLATQKVMPQPVAALTPPSDASPASGLKTWDTVETIKPTIGQSLELRSSVGHDEAAKPAQTRTADARGAISEISAPITMSDAAPSSTTPAPDAAQDSRKAGRGALPREETTAPDGAQPITENSVSVKASDASVGKAKAAGLRSEAEPTEANSEGTSSSRKPPAESSEVAFIKAKAVQPDGSDGTESRPDEMRVRGEASEDPVKPQVAASGDVKAEETKAKTDAPRTDGAKTEAANANIAKTTEKSVAAAVTTDVSSIAPDTNKDQGHVPGADQPAAENPNPALAVQKRNGQIAVFISRKDSKLYVRQNFMPLFDVPVTIAASDRPLGTHVFTAQVDKDDANVLHWSVVSLPAPAKHIERDEDEHSSRKRKAVAAEPKAGPVPDSPAEALDRLTLPADVMARVFEALSTGGSIVVSDQGIRAGETGEGTDFIVSLR